MTRAEVHSVLNQPSGSVPRQEREAGEDRKRPHSSRMVLSEALTLSSMKKAKPEGVFMGLVVHISQLSFLITILKAKCLRCPESEYVSIKEYHCVSTGVL